MSARYLMAIALLLSTGVAAGAPPIEVQLALQSFRGNERERLERALGPIEKLPLYRVDLDIDPVNKRVTGKVMLSLTTSRPLDHVTLQLTPNATHGRVMTVSHVQVVGASGAEIPGEEPGVLVVAFEPELAKGAHVTVSFDFVASVPPGEGEGAQGGDYGAYAASDDLVALPGLVPMLMPVKSNGEPVDLPSGIGDLGSFDPSNFILAARVPPSWRVLAPGVLTGDVGEAGKRRFTYALAGAREMPVFAVTGYRSVSQVVDGVTVESWYRADSVAGGKKVLEHAAKSLEQLERHLGPYPFTSLRVVEADFRDGAGGMEFPGLVTVSSHLYGGNKGAIGLFGGAGGADGDAALQAMLSELGDMGQMYSRLIEATLEFTVEHELAHQYFAMLVGSDPIDEPIVDEPLTQHTALLIMEWRNGATTANQMRDAQLKGSYQLLRMTQGADGIANRPTSKFADNVQYAALMYGKAPLMFDVWRKKLGDARWFEILRAYVDQYRYRWVNAKTLLSLAQRMAPGEASVLAALQTRWWNERHGDEDVGLSGLSTSMGHMLGDTGRVPDLPMQPHDMQDIEDAMHQLERQ